MSEARRIGYCPHCGNRAPHRLVHVALYRDSSAGPPTRIYVGICETCEKVVLSTGPEGIVPENGFNDPEWTTLLWPEPGTLPESIPDSIRERFDEALRIKQLSPNGFAVLVRSVLEALCRDRNAEGRNLAAQLANLAQKGEIPPTLAEMSDFLRVVGNLGAHTGEVAIGFVQALDDFLGSVLEYVYVAPDRLRRFREQFEALSEQDIPRPEPGP